MSLKRYFIALAIAASVLVSSVPGASATFQALAGTTPASTADTSFITAVTHFGGLRNNFPFSWGMKVTIGGTGVTVTQIGRWCHTGNSQVHTLSILDVSGAVLATVSVDASLGTPGTFQYGTLGTPYTLSPSTTYYFHSLEFSGGDLSCDAFGSTSLTFTGISTSVENSYETGGAPNNGGSFNDGYGPIDFKYH